MKKFGIVSYNIYCNFTNYGSALQSWALSQSINKLGYVSKLVDYCPDVLKDKNPLDPYKNMWDQDEESKKMCDLTMPAIIENYRKFSDFYNNAFEKTKSSYDSTNFNDSITEVDGFVCGSDTIFCPDEFGFDDGYYANYDVMKNGYTVAYAASFGDPHFTVETYKILNRRLKNFKAFGLRENLMISYVKGHVDVPVQKVVDPTLLLTSNDYNKLVKEVDVPKEYILLYSRRYSKTMEEYAEKLAKEYGAKIVEISLRAQNKYKGHIMKYDAGIEEFLYLVKNAKYVVTNSFHGMIFSVQYSRPFVIFSREQCNTKISELLSLFGLSDHMLITGKEKYNDIDYDKVHSNIEKTRKESLDFLKSELDGINNYVS